MTDRIFYTEDFKSIYGPSYRGWCIHLVCTEGTGGFIFNGQLFPVVKNDVVIVPQPHLITEVAEGDGFKVEAIMGELRYLNSQLPSHHYGIRGGINLHDNPVIHATEREVALLRRDFQILRERIADESHLYYGEAVEFATLSMVFDLFNCHARERGPLDSSERSANVVKRLTALLDTGTAKTHREVQWYAEKLSVSPRYLSETVKRITGDSVTYIVNRYAIPILTEYLKDDTFSFTQIADAMNFASLSYFSRYCTKHLGMTPSRFRAKSAMAEEAKK